MIAKFKYTYRENGQEITETVCGKVNAFKIRDIMANYEVTLTTGLLCVAGKEYDISKVSDATFYTKTNNIHVFTYKERNYHIDGVVYNFNEAFDRLNSIFINENIIIQDKADE